MLDFFESIQREERREVRIKKINSNCILPVRANKHAIGFDLYSCLDEDIELKPFERALIPTGFCMGMRHGVEAQIRPRSGLANKHGITVLNSPGTIDPDYRGEVKVLLVNFGSEMFTISHGMRIAQMVVVETSRAFITEVEEIDDTDRGAGGFGSTGL